MLPNCQNSVLISFGYVCVNCSTHRYLFHDSVNNHRHRFDRDMKSLHVDYDVVVCMRYLDVSICIYINICIYIIIYVHVYMYMFRYKADCSLRLRVCICLSEHHQWNETPLGNV